MSGSKGSSAGGGVSLGGLLFLLFLGLKLGHVISWSWWWVFAPLWIPAAIVAILLTVVGALMLAAPTSWHREARRRADEKARRGAVEGFRRVAPWD